MVCEKKYSFSDCTDNGVGPKAVGLQKANSKIDPEHEQLIGLMTSVYRTAIDNGVLND